MTMINSRFMKLFENMNKMKTENRHMSRFIGSSFAVLRPPSNNKSRAYKFKVIESEECILYSLNHIDPKGDATTASSDDTALFFKLS